MPISEASTRSTRSFAPADGIFTAPIRLMASSIFALALLASSVIFSGPEPFDTSRNGFSITAGRGTFS